MLKCNFKLLTSTFFFLALGGCSQCSNPDHSATAPPPPPPAGATIESATPPPDTSMNPGTDPSVDGAPMDADGADPAAVPPGKASNATEGVSGAPTSGGTDAH